MTEPKRNEIVSRWRAGESIRRIARELGLARNTVSGVLAQVEARRTGAGSPSRRRPSRLDPYESVIEELLGRYPELTAVRLLQELQQRGFSGSYTLVRQRLRELRPRSIAPPVVRFETGPGAQAQMDYAVYDLDFSGEGRRRVSLFSYILGYSRRQYLRFVEAQDFATTLREHVRAFEYLGGVAATCLYDNMKVVVSGHEDDVPIYNPRFLAFATHYGFRPIACRVRRPQTKGKVERPFGYVESSLLNGRSFETLNHLNETTGWWLAHVADVRELRHLGKTPLQLHQEELPHLIPLPAQAYDIDPVVYRVVDVEGLVTYRQNGYSVPWRYIGSDAAGAGDRERGHHLQSRDRGDRPACRCCRGVPPGKRACTRNTVPASMSSTARPSWNNDLRSWERSAVSFWRACCGRSGTVGTKRDGCWRCWGHTPGQT